MKPQPVTALRFLFVLMLLAAMPAQAASFDCAKAGSRAEKLICADQPLSDLDSQMAEAYKAALTKGDPPAADISKNQKSWLSFRAACARADLNDTDAIACLALQYRQRIDFLAVPKICRIDRLQDCSSTNQVMGNGGDKAVRRFLGPGKAAEEITELLEGVPEDLQTLPNGWILAAGCRAHDCSNKGAALLTQGGEVVATAALTYRCNDMKCVDDYGMRIHFRAGQDRAAVTGALESWAKTALSDIPQAHLSETQAEAIGAP